MLKGAHLLPLVAHAFLIQAVSSTKQGLEGGTFYQGTDLQFSIVETSKAQSAAAFAEHVFNLPSHHLSPVYGYASNQHQALMEHVRSPSSRFIALRRYKDEWSFVVSPWIVRRPGEEAWIRAMLLLQVWSRGIVTPLGYAVVKDGVPEGHKRHFWDTLQKAATMTQEQLVRKFNIDQVIVPVIV